MDNQNTTVKVLITKPKDTPLRLVEYADREELTEDQKAKGETVGRWRTDENGNLKHKREFVAGDVAEVQRSTALHLIATGQADLVEGEKLSPKHNGEGA